ncbi:MAG: methyltransferase domain-containing protein [Methyloligellaceae bacterium]
MSQDISEDEVSSAWDSNASQWTADVRAGFDLYRELYTFPEFLKFIPDIAGCDVLDLGCGEGTNTRKFFELGARVTGIDISQSMLDEAILEEQKDPRDIQYYRTSFTDLSRFSDNSFDHALSTMALMDGPDFDLAMKEAFRVLKPGGHLVFSVLHPCFMTSGFKWILSDDGMHEGLCVSRYFEEGGYTEEWKFSKRPGEDDVPLFRIPRFPKKLSDYINSVIGAGFKLSSLAEPRPDKALSEKHEWLKRWYDHAPLVLFVSAVKDIK